MGRLKGKILTGNHRCSPEIWDFPVIVPVNNMANFYNMDNIYSGIYKVNLSYLCCFIISRWIILPKILGIQIIQ